MPSVGVSVFGSKLSSSTKAFVGSSLAPLKQVANRGIIYNATRQATASNLLCGECRMSHKTGNHKLSEMRFVFSGFYIANGTGIETNVGNDQSIEVAVEWPGISTVQVTFNKQNVGTIVNGVAEYVSDPIYPSQFGLLYFPANTQFWFRSRRIVTSNQKHGKHGGSGLPGESTMYCDGSFPSQLLGTGVMVKQTGGANAIAELGPCAIIGRAIGKPDISVLSVGDSIMDGNNDTDIDGDGSDGGGFIMRGLLSVNSRTVPIMKMSVGGSLAQNFAAGYTKRSVYFKYFTHAFCNYGTNDLVAGRTAAQTFADLQTIWGALKTGGIKHVEQILTIMRVTSTDSYVTVANQTPLSGFEKGGAKRDPLNASIIGSVGSNGLDNYLDLSSPLIADGTNTDKWIVTGATNYATTDGTHPNPVLHALMAPLLTTRAATFA